MSEQTAGDETITVTGSLIGRKEIDSPAPMVVVDREKLDAAGVTNVGDILQKIPAQGNAINAQNNNGGDGSTRINLRSLGTSRTLVLMNGRRLVDSGNGANSSPDIGTIPLAMIDRVEVLKDGASAIYGSDAVAGVVNIITKSNFNGTEASIYSASSEHADGTNYDFSFVSGRSSNAGNVTFAAGYQNQESVMAGDRGFSSTTSKYNYSCSPAQAAAGCVVGGTTLSGSSAIPNGLINTDTGPMGAKAFSPPGCTSQFCTAVPGMPGLFRNYLGPTATEFNDAYNFQTLNYLYTPSTRVNLFSNGTYKVNKNTDAFYEAQYNSRKSAQQLAEEPIVLSQLAAQGVKIDANNGYNTLHTDITDYNRRLAEFGPRTADQNVDTARLVVGLKGSIPDDIPVVQDWRWEVSYNYGRSTADITRNGDLIVSHLKNALGPTYPDASGTLQCGTSAATQIKGCVPLNLLSPNSVSQAMINYLTFTSITSGLNEQHTALAQTNGKIVDLPNHGDISAAFGTDYRFERGANTPDPLTATGDTTGNASAPTAGSYHAFEGYGEVSIVPLSGTDIIKWSEIDAAARAYDYSTFGSGVTGKISGLIRTVDGIALRGTYGTAFRAPNVSELYAGQADNFVAIPDPCSADQIAGLSKTPSIQAEVQKQCTAAGVPMGSTFTLPQQRAKVGGNPQLTPEKGKVATVGAVYEPLPGLAGTLDYWHIRIDDAIQSLPTSTILSQCYQAGIQQFCNEVQRTGMGSNPINYIFDLTQNVGALTTSGLDFSASYTYRNDLGTFRHSFEGTYLFQYNVDTGTKDPASGKEQILHGRNFYDLGVNPDVKATLFTVWASPSGMGAGFNVRFVDGFEECNANNCNNPANLRRHVSAYGAGDLFASYAVKSRQGTTNVTLGVNNLTNAQPPAIYNGAALNADESAYDFMGRFLYLRLSQLF